MYQETNSIRLKNAQRQAAHLAEALAHVREESTWIEVALNVTDSLTSDREVVRPLVAEEKESDSSMVSNVGTEKRTTIQLVESEQSKLPPPGAATAKPTQRLVATHAYIPYDIKEKKIFHSDKIKRKAKPLKQLGTEHSTEKQRKVGLRQNPVATNRFRPDDITTHTIVNTSTSMEAITTAGIDPK